MEVTKPSWDIYVYIYVYIYINTYIHVFLRRSRCPASSENIRQVLFDVLNSAKPWQFFFRNILSQPGFSSLSFGVKILNKYATFQSINQKKTYQLLPSVTWTDHPNGGHLTPEKVTNKTLKCRSLVDTFEKLFSPPKKKHPFWNSWRAKSSWHQVLSPSCFCGTAPNIAAKRAVEAASGPRERVE